MKRVLIVDDEHIVRLSCTRSLAPAGYEVTTASDAEEALVKLNEGSYDIIMTDLKMPHMDGMEFIQRARQKHPSAKIVLVTGFATDETQEAAAALNVAYLGKPFTPAELLQKLAEL